MIDPRITEAIADIDAGNAFLAVEKLRTIEQEQAEHEENILEEANRIVGIGRGRSLRYGHPALNFSHTADLWRAAFGWEVNAARVAMAQILLKVSRECNTHTRDNLTDIAGYSRTLEMVHDFFEEQAAIREARKKIDEHVQPPGSCVSKFDIQPVGEAATTVQCSVGHVGHEPPHRAFHRGASVEWRDEDGYTVVE